MGHALSVVHVVWPFGHVVMPLQLDGRVVGSCPGHRTHVWPPHTGLPHSVFLTQRRHFVGSPSVVGPQPTESNGLIRMSWHVWATGSQIVQHPKQSQPGGASFPHREMQSGEVGVEPIGGGHDSGW